MPYVLPLLLLAAFAIAGEAEAAPLPPAAQTVVDRLTKAEAKIEDDAHKSRTAERQKALRDLERVQASVTRSGDLNAALAVKERIDAIRAADQADVPDLLGEGTAKLDPLKLAVGTWTVAKNNGINGIIELAAERTARATVGPFTVNGIWQVEKDRVVIHWGNNPNRWENLGFDGADRLAGDSHDAGKGGITLSRVMPTK